MAFLQANLDQVVDLSSFGGGQPQASSSFDPQPLPQPYPAKGDVFLCMVGFDFPLRETDSPMDVPCVSPTSETLMHVVLIVFGEHIG